MGQEGEAKLNLFIPDKSRLMSDDGTTTQEVRLLNFIVNQNICL